MDIFDEFIKLIRVLIIIIRIFTTLIFDSVFLRELSYKIINNHFSIILLNQTQ